MPTGGDIVRGSMHKEGRPFSASLDHKPQIGPFWTERDLELMAVIGAAFDEVRLLLEEQWVTLSDQKMWPSHAEDSRLC
jgi:hypothetical protein